MVMDTPKDPLELTEFDRTIIGKAATRIELPVITAEEGHALAPSDWRDIAEYIRGFCGALEFEVGRAQPARDTASRIVEEVRHLNRKLRAVRERAHKAAADRRDDAIREKKEGVARLTFRQAS